MGGVGWFQLNLKPSKMTYGYVPGEVVSEAKSDRPRDAASVVVFDRESGELRVLMGQRQATQAFMPGKFVFPGGRVDPEDKTIGTAGTLAESERAKLLADMKGTPSNARALALALAAIREAYEEAGLIIGASETANQTGKVGHPSWESFLGNGHIPTPAVLTFFARAITPPGRTRRFDTRFFCVERSEVATQTVAPDGELSELGWYSLLEIKSLDLAPITQVVLDEFCDRLSVGPLGPSRHPVPFYHQNRGVFHRDLLTASTE